MARYTFTVYPIDILYLVSPLIYLFLSRSSFSLVLYFSMFYSMVSHPHLIKYYGSCQHEKSVYIVTEYMNGGNLSSILKRTEVPISWKLRISIARDIMGAIAWLHSNDLIHRDIKTENILVNDDWHCVLADYGFARKFKQSEGKSAMTILGTDEFMAPEVVFGEEYDERADLYSFGLVLVEMITRRIPGKNNFLMRLPKKKFAIDFEELRAAVPSDIPSSLLECTIQCLAYDPEDRLTSDTVLDWLNDLHKELTTNSIKNNEPLSPRPSLILASTNTGSSSSSSTATGNVSETSQTTLGTGGAASMPAANTIEGTG